MNKTFRALMAHETILRIRLSSNNGLKGYRIKNFDSIHKTPGTGSDIEALFQVYTKEPPSVSANVDFGDPTLIAVNYNKMGNVVTDNDDRTIIMDNVVFNQDIFVAYDDGTGNENSCNFILELEQVALSKDEATVATLKDMRAGPDTNFGP